MSTQYFLFTYSSHFSSPKFMMSGSTAPIITMKKTKFFHFSFFILPRLLKTYRRNWRDIYNVAGLHVPASTLLNHLLGCLAVDVELCQSHDVRQVHQPHRTSNFHLVALFAPERHPLNSKFVDNCCSSLIECDFPAIFCWLVVFQMPSNQLVARLLVQLAS